jgi:hypothetical protein
MNRRGLVPSILLSSAFLISACPPTDQRVPDTATTSTTSTTTRETATRKDLPVQPIEYPRGVEIIRVSTYVGSEKLQDCPAKASTPDPKEPGVGGFACWFIYPIDIKALADGSVTVTPLVKLRTGDCVRWTATAADGNPVKITLINFFDTDQEAADAGKPAGIKGNPWPINKDFCTEGTPECFMYIALGEGTYRYQVKVEHNGLTKIADPELEVTCSGPGCGDPTQVSGL